MDFNKADLVCSDAAPEFVGERFVDHMRAIELNYMVMGLCKKNLRKGGSLLMKIMQGPAEQTLFDDAKLKFDKLQRVKPNASRQESKEIYFLGQGYEES
jgi:23S rRNA (uridine2552-2'-O)-methyltransferase